MTTDSTQCAGISFSLYSSVKLLEANTLCALKKELVMLKANLKISNELINLVKINLTF